VLDPSAEKRSKALAHGEYQGLSQDLDHCQQKSNGSTDKATRHVIRASSLQTRSGMRQLPVNEMKLIYPKSDIHNETIEQIMHH